MSCQLFLANGGYPATTRSNLGVDAHYRRCYTPPNYRKSWNEAGHPGAAGDISVRVPMYIGTTREGAIEEPRGSLEAFFTRMRVRYEQGRDEEGSGDTGTDRVAALKARAE